LGEEGGGASAGVGVAAVESGRGDHGCGDGGGQGRGEEVVAQDVGVAAFRADFAVAVDAGDCGVEVEEGVTGRCSGAVVVSGWSGW
jgi:hypothetical protein